MEYPQVVQIMGLRQENLVSENGSQFTNVGPENLLTYSEPLFSIFKLE